MTIPTLLSQAFALCFIYMTLCWVLALILKNFSLVDIAWSYGFALVTILYAASAPGFAARKAILGGMFILWSLRLGTHLLLRIASHYPREDGRYEELRKTWRNGLNWKFFLFFQFQGVSIPLLSIPMLLASFNLNEQIQPLEWVGLAIWITGWIGESLSDRQLNNFKKDPAQKGKTCDIGLWRYSRHPNYFFEWVMWCGYAVFALASPLGWIALYCPATILLLLLKVTGIPTAEAQSLRSRGKEYANYQERTSAFIPWFPRKL